MKKRFYRDYLEDIFDAVEEIASFINGMSKRDFLRDKRTINAVIRSLEVMGEASKKIPGTIKKRPSSIPWKKMEGMRNKMIHEYFGIDKEILWLTAKNDVPTLREPINILLSELEPE
ncbi:MAG: DUF86 domain-containing protein [Desulfobacterales bacterium]|nr:DUF86 domain-containing protein [Desulfobacterales bacterium]